MWGAGASGIVKGFGLLESASTSSDTEFALLRLDNGWTVGRFAPLEELGFVVHAVTTREGLDPVRAGRNRPAAATRLGAALGVKRVAYCRQVHGRSVVVVDSPGLAGEADGLMTDRPDLAMVGFSADCPLVLLADASTGAVGLVHASWRSTVEGITGRAVRVMRSQLGSRAETITACICPSAGPCCYEVGEDVREAARRSLGPGAEAFFPRRGERLFFDLCSANTEQLTQAGLSGKNIHPSGMCTICRNDLFPSHRVQGPGAGRFLAAIARIR